MDNKKFKALFTEIARKNGFVSAFNAWFKESNECMNLLELQKSNYGNQYQLMFKVFVKGAFNESYQISKNLLKEFGYILEHVPKKFECFLDLEENIEDDEREKGLENLFNDFITPLTMYTVSRAGIKKLNQENRIHVSKILLAEIERLDKEGVNK